MISARNQPAARCLLTLFDLGRVGDLTDGQLIQHFAGGGSSGELAFRALIERHGPMVMGICRRSLVDLHDAEDAFQATFLVLVKRANTIRRRDSLACWLRGVARRVSADARASVARRHRHERHAAAFADRMTVGCIESAGESFDLAQVLEEELARLPDKYRSPVVLCHLKGMTHEEAAERLKCPVGTVRSRLSRARERLRVRLVRRGMATAPALRAVSLASSLQTVSSALVDLTEGSVAGEAMRHATVSPSVATLLRRELSRAVLNQLKIGASALLALTVVTAGSLATATPGQEPAIVESNRQLTPEKAIAPLPTRAEIRDSLKNWWDSLTTLEFREQTTECGPDGEPRKGGFRSLVDYAHAPGNRRVVRYGLISAEGAETLWQERRYDGEVQTDVSGDSKFPPKIGYLSVSDQTDTRDRYEGAKSAVLWSMMGRGDDDASRPYYSLIDRGSPIEISRDQSGSPQAILTINRFGRILRVELDPDHSWLPRKITGIATVSKFAQNHGVWFPVEGISDDPGRTSTFRVVDLRINRPIRGGRDRFVLPPDLTGRALVEKPRAFGYETLAEAKVHPKDPKYLEALLAILVNSRIRGGAVAEAVDLLLENYVNDPAIAQATHVISIDMITYHRDLGSQFIRAVVERTSNREVRARATLDLAHLLWHRAALGLLNTVIRRQQERANAKVPFMARGRLIDEPTFTSMIAEAEQLCRKVMADFADVDTLAAAARRELSYMPTFRVGSVAPEIDGLDIDGKPMRLSDYRGKVVLLFFWGDSSPLCRSEYDAVLEAIHAAAGKPFILLGINSDTDRSAVQKLVRSKEPFAHCWLEGSTNGPIAQAWQVKNWPMTYVLDTQGRIRVVGVLGPDIRRSVERILAETASRPPTD
jgi:RNA polymerase sigma factor (sigma-70 family)